MGIGLRISQEGSDALLKFFTDEMLQPLCFIVQLLNRVVQDLEEERLNQAVMANDLQGSVAALVGQGDAAMAFVPDQWRGGRGQSLQHVRRGGRRNVELIRDLRVPHLPQPIA